MLKQKQKKKRFSPQGHFIGITSGGVLLFFYFSHLSISTQHRGAGRRSADENLMFEGIGSNSQQAGLRICRTNALLANFVPNSVQPQLYRKNSYTEFFARAQFIKDFLSRIRYNFSKPGSVSDAKMLRIPLIFGITFFFWTIKGTACQISSFMYHFRPYSFFKVSSSSTL